MDQIQIFSVLQTIYTEFQAVFYSDGHIYSYLIFRV